jgi:hypothetical protein
MPDTPPLVDGPQWSTVSDDSVAGRYPLRVESYVSGIVDRLLPGVTSVTTHARYFSLHPFIWDIAARRNLDLSETYELIRRCEVVIAGVSHLHDHVEDVPGAHGVDRVGTSIDSNGELRVAELQQPNGYSTQTGGFSGTYRGSQVKLGLLTSEPDNSARPGERYNRSASQTAFEDLMDLASADALPVDTLHDAAHLCVCASMGAPDGRHLSRLLLDPEHSPEFLKPDRARRSTARLLARVISSTAMTAPESDFASAMAFGRFVETDSVASAISAAVPWRGVILRNYVVGAWRRLWSLLVDTLDEPTPIQHISAQLAANLPDVTIGELREALPDSMHQGEVLPAEAALRSEAQRDTLTEIKLLILAARRVDELDEHTLRYYSARTDEPLSPHWLKSQMRDRQRDTAASFLDTMLHRLVDRADRVALDKMHVRQDGSVWIPTRVRQREGRLIRLSAEGWNDVGFRIGSFANVLHTAGALSTNTSQWSLTKEGAALLD